jgi:hypothetical protein
VIIVALMGGLGNQLFQYAAGRRLASDTGRPLKLDLTTYESDTRRSYRLGPFNTCQDVATREEIRRVKPSLEDAGRGWWPARLLRNRRYAKTWLRERTPYVYDAGLMGAARETQDVHLEGYWANELYFKPIEPVIRRELTLTSEPDGENLTAARAMASTTSVCLHVRRGDYASDPATRQFHGLMPLSYYEQAVARLMETVTDPHFFVFSDDPAWVKEHLRLQRPVTYVTHNGAGTDYEDLRLMASCRHHIIANSSFSWWGAWLARSPAQIVIAPAQWLVQPGIDTTGATPAEWIRL